MKPIVLLMLYGICLCPYFTYSQGLSGPYGAQAWMNGGNSVSQNNVWSVSNNPGGASFLRKPEAGIYSEQRFNISANRLNAITLCLPTKPLVYGLGISSFGFESFTQQQFTLSLSKQLNSAFGLGVQIGCVSTNIKEYGNAFAFIGGLGILYKLNEKVSAGLHFYNLNRAKYTSTLAERIPSILRAGLTYRLSPYVELSGELDQSLDQQAIPRIGLSYKAYKGIEIGLGICNNPFYWTFGIGVEFRQFRMHFASSLHQTLGFTPHVDLQFPLSKTKHEAKAGS